MSFMSWPINVRSCSIWLWVINFLNQTNSPDYIILIRLVPKPWLHNFAQIFHFFYTNSYVKISWGSKWKWNYRIFKMNNCFFLDFSTAMQLHDFTDLQSFPSRLRNLTICLSENIFLEGFLRKVYTFISSVESLHIIGNFSWLWIFSCSWQYNDV